MKSIIAVRHGRKAEENIAMDGRGCKAKGISP